MAEFISENNLKYFKVLIKKVCCTLRHVSINMLQMTGKVSVQNFRCCNQPPFCKFNANYNIKYLIVFFFFLPKTSPITNLTPD